MEDNTIIISIFIIIVTVTIAVFSYRYINSPFDGHFFCKSQGYESNSFFGDYNERLGKIECVSCYKLECEYKEFNVTKTFWGLKRK